MIVEHNAPLRAHNTLGLAARAKTLVRVTSEADVRAVLADPDFGASPKFVLGGGSNVVLTRDLNAVVLKVEVAGKRIVEDGPGVAVVEFGAGENWHDAVAWSIDRGLDGLENLALIPGTVGAAPVQNIGAYGVELRDRFDSLDAIDLTTGRAFTLDAPRCAFGYRDSIFKHPPAGGGPGLAGRALILRVRLRLPRPWTPTLNYLDLQRKAAEAGVAAPTARQVFDWVCAIRGAKLPDPRVLGNAGSFFKNPTVPPEQGRDLLARHPGLAHYPMPDGTLKLAAGWLIDACGWKGRSMGRAGVYEKQALVLVNRGDATGDEVMALARAIQASVEQRFGVRLEPEPVVV